MIEKPRPRNSWLTVLLIIGAITVWGYNQFHTLTPAARESQPAAHTDRQAPGSPLTKSESKILAKVGGYEVYRGCTLSQARNNDGDSFMVQLPDGKKAEFRLYFVDTPESAFKSYPGGDNNHERIGQQAAEMGGITPQQAVEMGQKGKHFTLDLLASQPFDIYTRWDSPFNDNRFHAFVEVRQGGKSRWLDELLVERGLARIKTKPADLPDGTPAAKQLAHLKDLERAAKRSEAGVWGLR